MSSATWRLPVGFCWLFRFDVEDIVFDIVWLHLRNQLQVAESLDVNNETTINVANERGMVIIPG